MLRLAAMAAAWVEAVVGRVSTQSVWGCESANTWVSVILCVHVGIGRESIGWCWPGASVAGCASAITLVLRQQGHQQPAVKEVAGIVKVNHRSPPHVPGGSHTVGLPSRFQPAPSPHARP